MLHENLLKCLLNIFIGIAICVQPLYLGEIAPTSLRGAMGMGTSIFITGGIFTGQVIGLRWWINTLRRRTFHTVPMLHPFKEKYQAEVLVQLYRELLGKEEYWPILLSTTCIPAFLQLLILPWFPESPRYLLIDKGDEEGCKKGKTAAPFLPFQIAGNCILPGKMT